MTEDETNRYRYSRERRLLFAVAVLAPLVEAVMFLDFYHPGQPNRPELISELRHCQMQTARVIARCTARHIERHGA